MAQVLDLGGEVVRAAGSPHGDDQSGIAEWGGGECGVKQGPAFWYPLVALGMEDAGAFDLNVVRNGAVIFRGGVGGGQAADRLVIINDDAPGEVSAFGMAATTSSMAAVTLVALATRASSSIWPRRSTRPLNGRMESISTPSTEEAAVMRTSAMAPWGSSMTMSSITVPSGKFSTISTDWILPSTSPKASASWPRLPGASGSSTRIKKDKVSHAFGSL